MTGEAEPPERPVVGVGVVVWKGARLLLIRRGKSPMRGRWSLPGGRQELGETVRETAVREVREETGVEIRLGALIDVVDTIRRDESGAVDLQYTLVDFDADWIAGEPAGRQRRRMRRMGRPRRSRALPPVERNPAHRCPVAERRG